MKSFGFNRNILYTCSISEKSTWTAFQFQKFTHTNTNWFQSPCGKSTLLCSSCILEVGSGAMDCFMDSYLKVSEFVLFFLRWEKAASGNHILWLLHVALQSSANLDQSLSDKPNTGVNTGSIAGCERGCWVANSVAFLWESLKYHQSLLLPLPPLLCQSPFSRGSIWDTRLSPWAQESVVLNHTKDCAIFLPTKIALLATGWEMILKQKGSNGKIKALWLLWGQHSETGQRRDLFVWFCLMQLCILSPCNYFNLHLWDPQPTEN